MNRYDFSRRNGERFSIWLEIDEAKLAEYMASKFCNRSDKPATMKIGGGSIIAHIKEQ